MTPEHAQLDRWIGRRDEEAFHGIVRRYSGLVYGACLRVLRNDADAQEAALDAFLALSQLKRVPDAPLGAWLHRTAVHRAIDRYRKTQTRAQYEAAVAREGTAETAACGWDDISGLVDEAVAALPEDLRAAVVGHFFEGKTHAELAEAAGLTRPAITKRVHNGVEEVRNRLIKKGVTVGSVAALALLLTEHAVAAPAVPAALAASLGKVAVSGFTATGAAAGAAAGASLGLAAKTLIAAVVLTLVAGVGYTFLPGIVKRNMVLLKSIPMTMAKAEYRKRFPKQTAKTAVAADAEKSTSGATNATEVGNAALDGGLTITGALLGVLGAGAGEAEIVMEKVTWAPNETPPAQTEKRFGRADSNGNFTIEHLSDGDWSLSARGDLGSGGRWINIEGGAVTYPNPITVEAYPCVPCSGVVLDEAGAPVPGAVIYPAGHELDPTADFSHFFGAASRAQTDKDGRFHFDRMVEGGMKYFVAIPGGVPRYTDYVQTGDNARIQLPPPGRIRGRVVAEGVVGGLEGLTLKFLSGWYRCPKVIDGVRTVYNGGRIEQTVTTDRNGIFLAERVPGAEYQLENLTKTNWVISERIKVDVLAGKESTVTIHVDRGRSLSGQVVDAQTGESLGAGVEICAGSENGSASAVTDADGYYRFDNLPKGKYPLQVSCPLVKGGPATYSFNSYGGGKPEWSVDMNTGERLDLRVDRTQMHGVVTDHNNAPVAGVEIRANAVVLAKSGNDGRFNVRCISTNTPLRVEAEKDGWRALQMVELLPGGETEANLKLSYASTGELSGMVSIKGGESAAGAELNGGVCLNCNDPEHSSWTLSDGKSVIVGPNGEFSLTGLLPGGYGFGLYDRASRRTFLTAETVTLKPGEQRRDVRLEFEPLQKRTMAGVVVNDAGQPIPECQVYDASWGGGVRTGPDGWFSLELERIAKEEQVYFSANGYAQLSVSLELDRSDHVITLKPLQRLYGRVVDTTGAPVTAFSVTVGQVTKEFVDASGAFDLPEVCPPPAGVMVSAKGYGTTTVHYDGQTYACPVQIVLPPPAVIEGTVVDAEGNPLAGYYVTCEGDPLITDAAGHFSCDTFGVGTECALIVSKTRFTPRAWWGFVTAPASVVCRVGQTGSLSLAVTADGVPVTDPATFDRDFTASVQWHTENGVALQAPFYGPFHTQEPNRITCLPVGPVEVRVRMNALEAYGPAVCEKVVEAQVVANEETVVQVNFETPGAAVPAEAPTTDTAPATPGATEE